MSPIFLLLLFPLIWPFVAKRIWNAEITWTELGLNIVIIAALSAGTYQLGKWGQTQDTEIWNGAVVKKEMDDGHYVRSYDCNCYESCSGSGDNRSCTTVCQTCYEDHYTRSYDGYTTVGNFTFDYIDTTSRSRRNSFPPPQSYKNCKPGEPASIEHSYTNYVQAVPQSLFNDNSNVAEQYAGQIPAYPRVFGFYKINRILNVGSKVPSAVQRDLNQQLNEALISLGASKQANIVVIFTNIMDPSYRYAIENAWLGGEKNDVIIFIGTEDGTTIGWTDVMTWALNAGNELFHVKMRDALRQTPLTADALTATISSTITTEYDRPHMADYEYLKDEIKPAPWVMGLAIFFSIVGSMLLTFLFHRVDVDFFRGNRYRRW
jgi:hypothetical protein